MGNPERERSVLGAGMNDDGLLRSLGAVVAVPVILNYVWLSDVAELVIRWARWPALFVAVALALACLYRFGPSREAPRWRWLTWGSAVATLLWVAASALFSWYAANFGTLNETTVRSERRSDS
jgi:membrane protein